MTLRELPHHELASLMAQVSRNLTECHPHDVLTLAGFLATNAIRCWAPEERIPIAGAWCDHVLATLRESLD
jgi:hypothetical protein